MYVVSLLARIAVFAMLIYVFGAISGNAAVLDITSFNRSEHAAARQALSAFQKGTDLAPGQAMTGVRTETFSKFKAWDGTSGAVNPKTAVGAFTALGGRGNGGSAINGGTGLQVRNEDPWKWGRFNSGGAGGKWLDSNDTLGMRWEVKSKGGFNALGFLLTDVADAGARFSIKVGDTLFSDLLGASGRLANGSIQFVRILLPATVTNLTVELRNSRRNDGFGIDRASVGRVAPVPLPPAALLLVSAAAALVALRRRRAA